MSRRIDVMSEPASHTDDLRAPLHGLLAEYTTPEHLLEAARRVARAGYRCWDTFTPFPVHGIDRAMAIKPTVLPWLVLGAGLTGCASAVLLQWWTNAVDYPFAISGKPTFSLLANIPITFELTVLFSALTAFLGMLLLNGLPRPAHPLHLSERFARASDDRFFLLIERRDPKYDPYQTRVLLEGTEAIASIEELFEDTASSNKLPRSVIQALLIIGTALTVPFALAALSRVSTSDHTRFHIVPDMDSQQKFKAQRKNAFFADQRAMRPILQDTVALGELKEDEHFFRGKLGAGFARTFPPAVKLDEPTMARGKQQFDVYCTPCHGDNGLGQGMVQQRITSLSPTARATWVPPANLTLDNTRYMPIGQVFDVITNGIRNMPGYRAQVEAADRWAIALYLRALQRAQTVAAADLPASTVSPPP